MELQKHASIAAWCYWSVYTSIIPSLRLPFNTKEILLHLVLLPVVDNICLCACRPLGSQRAALVLVKWCLLVSSVCRLTLSHQIICPLKLVFDQSWSVASMDAVSLPVRWIMGHMSPICNINQWVRLLPEPFVPARSAWRANKGAVVNGHNFDVLFHYHMLPCEMKLVIRHLKSFRFQNPLGFNIPAMSGLELPYF